MQFVKNELVKKYDPAGKRLALIDRRSGLRAGDIIRVTYYDRSTNLGQVIAVKRGHNAIGANILIRNKLTKVGCEVRVPLYNPRIRNIELLKQPKKYLPRAKHYYIRGTRYDVGDVSVALKQKST